MTAAQITDKLFLTTAEVAKVLGIAQDKVNDLINDGSLIGTNIARHAGGRPRYRIHRDDLASFLASRRTQPPAPAPQRKRREQEATAYY